LEAEADGIIAAVDEADIIMKEEDKKICSYDVVQPPASVILGVGGLG